ncbi:hypothetical protein LTR29_003393 [Friedmanniomyces endolithicus]|nr:hypothetical protein LTR29_003393 [Friedmanniomyces endolithicus]
MKSILALSALASLAASAVYDPSCACHMTKTALAPTGTIAYPMSTYTWWETECGCHRTAAVPVPSSVPASNYTAPMQPPAVSATPTSSVPVPVPAAATAPSAEAYTGTNGAAAMTGSVVGVVGVVALAFALV